MEMRKKFFDEFSNDFIKKNEIIVLLSFNSRRIFSSIIQFERNIFTFGSSPSNIDYPSDLQQLKYTNQLINNSAIAHLLNIKLISY